MIAAEIKLRLKGRPFCAPSALSIPISQIVIWSGTFPLRGVMERGRADILVVDSAAFIKRYQLQNYCKKAVTIREVVAEIKDPQTRQSLQVLPYELEIKEPGHASIAHGEGGWPHSVARGEGGWPHSVARGEGGWPHSVARGEGGCVRILFYVQYSCHGFAVLINIPHCKFQC